MAFLRRSWLSILVGLAVGAALILTVVALVKLGDTNARLAANVNAQVTNRAANVRTWCGAINQGRDYDRVFVRATTRGHVQYQLADLNCPSLVAATLKSAHHK